MASARSGAAGCESSNDGVHDVDGTERNGPLQLLDHLPVLAFLLLIAKRRIVEFGMVRFIEWGVDDGTFLRWLPTAVARGFS